MALKRLFAKMHDDHNEILPFDERFRADLVTSELTDGRHAPALDLDVPAYLVPSRTEGHHHLYIEVPCSWKQYRKLLKALRDCGIIEPGYYRASVKAGRTHLRKPGRWDGSGDDDRLGRALAQASRAFADMKANRIPGSVDVYASRYDGARGGGGY